MRDFAKLMLAIMWTVCCLPACTHKAEPPRVVDGWEDPSQTQHYQVQAGDTLYSVAWAYGLDHHALANSNHLRPPYHLKEGDVLLLNRIRPTQRIAHVVELDRTKVVSSEVKVMPPIEGELPPPVVSGQKIPLAAASSLGQSKAALPMHANTMAWRWPASGKVVHQFSPHEDRKGIDIVGVFASPVRATAAGEVVYSGSGLRGYGRLLILKHGHDYLSAYAYNQKLLVREGDHVRAGQVIATMGDQKPGGKAMLHFEVRRHGVPVNPMKFLKT